MKLRRIAIVDVDGTVADVRHRLHFISGPGRKDWKRFFQAMELDTPMEEVIGQVRELAREHEIVIVTGRPEGYRARTAAWLEKYDVPYARLLMRRCGDHRPDYVVKEELLAQLGRENVRLALDDRQQVCDMYRGAGIKVWQVESGEEARIVNEAYQKRGKKS